MTVLGVPDVVVAERVDVHLEPTIVVHVDVGDVEFVRWAIRATTDSINHSFLVYHI